MLHTIIPENNEFKFYLTESLLIKRDKPEINGNMYTHSLEPFTRIIVLLVTPGFYESFNNGSSL